MKIPNIKVVSLAGLLAVVSAQSASAAECSERDINSTLNDAIMQSVMVVKYLIGNTKDVPRARILYQGTVRQYELASAMLNDCSEGEAITQRERVEKFGQHLDKDYFAELKDN